jgi:hypothetical protein
MEPYIPHGERSAGRAGRAASRASAEDGCQFSRTLARRTWKAQHAVSYEARPGSTRARQPRQSLQRCIPACLGIKWCRVAQQRPSCSVCGVHQTSPPASPHPQPFFIQEDRSTHVERKILPPSFNVTSTPRPSRAQASASSFFARNVTMASFAISRRRRRCDKFPFVNFGIEPMNHSDVFGQVRRPVLQRAAIGPGF